MGGTDIRLTDRPIIIVETYDETVVSRGCEYKEQNEGLYPKRMSKAVKILSK